ncbi:hypothetical protein T11_3788 [Trichinella zimbabwensis]|uniref:Uncharacterized protein n=1 Tax=Trichinella zimbabwensis TaxID=268475 RepID=A0A0V1HML0_9BILA|nr:hypothetical protein T11_3788 [Trichinella zimbabwensis]
MLLGISPSPSSPLCGGLLIPPEYTHKPHMLLVMRHRRCGVLSFAPVSSGTGSKPWRFLF